MKQPRIPTNIYRLRRDLITEEVLKTVPTVCGLKRTLEWWTSNKLATLEDLELIPYNEIIK